MLRHTSWANVISVLSATVIAGALASLSFFRSDEAAEVAPAQVQPLPLDPLSLDGAPIKGNPAAGVGIVMFSDFECPFCGRLARETLPAIETTYVRSGSVLLAFRHFPIEQIHPFARQAAETAACADAQGQFWRVHDLFFADQRRVTESGIAARLREVDVNRERLSDCLQSAGRARVDADLGQVRNLDVRSTPTLYVGPVRNQKLVAAYAFSGVPPARQLDEAIGLLLKEAGNARE